MDEDELQLDAIEHQGRLANAPVRWQLSGYDGNYVATVSGGDAESRQQALDQAFTHLGDFSEKFRDALDGSQLGAIDGAAQPSYFTLRSPMDTPAQAALESKIHISYRPQRGNAERPGATERSRCEEMRTFIEQCLGIDGKQRTR